MASRSGTGKGGNRPSLPSRPLLSLRPGQDLSANIRLEGNLISIVPYDVSTRTCAFTIVQNSCRVKCMLKGPWAMAAPDYFRTNMNRAICIITDGTETVKVVSQERDRNGDPVMGGNQLGVSFENGISGYWRGEGGNGRKEPFHLKKSTAQPYTTVELSSEPDRESRPRYRQAPRETAVSALQERTNLQAPPVSTEAAKSSMEAFYKGLQVPTPMPAGDPLVGVVQVPTPRPDPREELANRRGPAKREAPNSSPSQAAAASSHGKMAAKRQRKEERTEWGFKTGSHTYHSLIDFVTKNPTPVDRKLGLNVIAVARIKYPPSQIKPNSDYGMCIELYDPTYTAPGGVTLRYYAYEDQFRQNSQILPTVRDGDILLVQRVNWTKDKQQFTAYKEKAEYFVLSPDELLKGSPRAAFSAPTVRAATITDAEVGYARDLARWSRRNGLEQQIRGQAGTEPGAADPSGPAIAPPAATDVKLVSAALAKPRRGRPMLLIQDLVPDSFCDLYAEIVRCFIPSNAPRQLSQHECCTLFVTDYTPNPQMIDYQEDSKNGIPGQLVLQVSVWGAQCEPLLRFKDADLKGRIVHLRNIRPKTNKDGLLEATLFEDYKFADKRDVTFVGKNVATDPATKDWFEKLTARRKAFWSGTGSGDGPAAIELAHVAAAAAPGAALPSADHAEPVIDPLSKSLLPAQICDIRGLRVLSSLADSVALDSPGTYRTRVRVVDYYPPQIEDWVFATCPVCRETLGRSELACMSHGQISYRWMFFLALADENDASCQVRVIIDEPVADGATETKIITGMSVQDAAQVRSGDSVALRRFRDEVLRGIVGTIPDAHRHKKPIEYGMAGPAWDVVLEAERVEEGAPVEWQFKPGKVTFW
ncbi:hypothetical protein RHOSPDRAFT_33214 [Rhodotorula sp. JG-1b]|nr:hypothetical protein RHOSPDRAFT_33214 [Rhodotorula sp. JG-1b]